MFLLSRAMPVLALVPRGRWWKGALEIAGTHETKDCFFFRRNLLPVCPVLYFMIQRHPLQNVFWIHNAIDKIVLHNIVSLIIQQSSCTSATQLFTLNLRSRSLGLARTIFLGFVDSLTGRMWELTTRYLACESIPKLY